MREMGRCAAIMKLECKEDMFRVAMILRIMPKLLCFSRPVSS